ncbi:MAG: hypothetical protein ACK4S2_07240 [Gemmobacter sp.]|uniref:hypothetical protein n=1 Tax=Gemmobacter sp. TaxID=1898957 RepID=UPI00391BA722
MTASDPPSPGKRPPPLSRDARLKAALKANLARRKAQARGRAAGLDEDDGESRAANDTDNGQDKG